jgi:vancomycin resistance protein YoaR
MTSSEDQKVVEDDTPTVKLPAQRRPQDSPGPAAPPGPPKRRGRRRLIAGGVALAMILATAGGAVAYTLHGDVPRGVTVLGLDLGGKSEAQATKALQEHLATRSTVPVRVQVDGRAGTVRPQEVGLAADIPATLAAATRGRPALFGDRDVVVVSRVDVKRLDTALRRAFSGAGQPARMPAITFTGTTPKAVHPTAGRGLDPEQSAEAIRQGWLTGQTVTVPLVEVRPATTAADVDRLLATLARPAVAAPVTVTTDRGTLTIAPAAIAQSLILTADRTGLITPRIDDKKLRTALTIPLRAVEKAPVGARFTFAAGRPRIAADVPGNAVDLAALGPQLLSVLPRSDNRTIAATLRPATPKVTAAQLAKLGIAERVSTFTTKFPGGLGSPRSQNIVQIAKEVDGALVLPGKVFSLNGHTGERSYAQGYKDAPVILDGKLTPGVGGGASQFTTTLFNATYYAGMQDVEHKPHSYYFSRYPPVIESTIFYPDLDFKFKNNTRYGVYLDTSWTSNTITVSVWSTKVYDKVTTQWGPRRNITNPRTITLEAGPKCIETNGIDGFTQDAFRLFHTGGKVVKREKFTWTYGAEPRYICAPKS